jgi:hypothetical protein
MFQEDTARYDSLTRPWERRDADRLRAQVADDSHSYTGEDGVRRWRSNDAIIPPHVLRDACLVCPEAHTAAYEAETAAFLAEYRRNRSNRRLSAEERFEMRAAFGPGVEVVDVITGQTWRT